MVNEWPAGSAGHFDVPSKRLRNAPGVSGYDDPLRHAAPEVEARAQASASIAAASLSDCAAALPLVQFEDSACKNIDDALCEIGELCESWDNRLSVKNLAITERYFKGELEFGLVLVARIEKAAITREYVAVFERKRAIKWQGGVSILAGG